MDDSGPAESPDAASPEESAGGQGAGGGRPARRAAARYARPALIAGLGITVVCAALLVIIFLLDSFNATVYSVGGADVSDATDEARAIRDTYAAARTGGIAFLIAGGALAAGAGLLLYRHRNDAGAGGPDGEDVDFADLGEQ